MLIKIDKQRVVEAAIEKIDILRELENKSVNRAISSYESLRDDDGSMSRIDSAVAFATIKPGRYGGSINAKMISKLTSILNACGLTEEQTVTITDEDVELLGL